MFFVLAAAAVTLATHCASTRGLPREDNLHPRLTPTAYLEEGKLVAFAVDTEAAAWRDKEPLIPLPVSVANKGLINLTISRESFTLVDEQGNRYPLATVEQGREVGGLTSIDWSMSARFFEVISSSYSSWTYENAVFFPNNLSSPAFARRGLLRDRLELPKFTWSADILYFPHPKGPVPGHRFEIWLGAPELRESVFVKFRVPVR
jgi:hypothetical protein